MMNYSGCLSNHLLDFESSSIVGRGGSSGFEDAEHPASSAHPAPLGSGMSYADSLAS